MRYFLPRVTLCAVMGCSPALADTITRVLITDAKVDFVNHLITISGFNFGNGALNVMLDNAVLPVVSHGQTTIVATLSPIPPAGTYLLDVSVGFVENLPLLFDLFDVTIGTQGPQGIQGIQGVQGQTGPQGQQGNQGPQGPQGAQGQPGSAGAQGAQGTQGLAGLGPATMSVGAFSTDLSAGVNVNSVSLPAGSYVLIFSTTAINSDADDQTVTCTLSTGPRAIVRIPGEGNAFFLSTVSLLGSATFATTTTVTVSCEGFEIDAEFPTLAAIQVSAIH